MADKLYFYVDESGQDTRGAFFVVAVAVAGNDLDTWHKVCEGIEQESGKGRAKWAAANYRRRLAYMGLVLHNPLFAGKLAYTVYTAGQNYEAFTIRTIARAVKFVGGDSSKVICVDALPKKLYVHYGKAIRQQGAAIEKVTGIKRDERNALIRLADAVCGFVRDACFDDFPQAKELLDQALKDGVITDLK